MAKDDPTFGRFQSPLHRGNHFNDEIGASDEVPNIDFSPLFIGEITSTSLLIRLLGEETRFQSPLHRGNHFNIAADSAARRRASISVPSSSGKSLQQDINRF